MISDRYKQKDHLKFWLILITTLWGLVGCNAFQSSPLLDVAVNPEMVEQIIPTAVNTPQLDSLDNQTAPAEATPEPINDLILWMLPEISPNSDAAGSNTLQQQINRFDTNHPDIDVVVEQKVASGPASLQNYLETGIDIAPEILPDLALIPAFLLPELVSQEQIYPLTDLIPAAELSDLLPVGQQMGRVGEIFYSYPYATTGLHHAIYNPEIITSTLSSDWNTLFTNNYSFVFPASSASGIQLLLQFYLAEGGTLRNETGKIQLEVEPLQRALQTLQNGRSAGFVHPQSGTTTTEDDAWRLFTSDQATIAQTSVTQYLNQQAQGITPSYASLPGKETALVPQVSGWVWVITTPDPARQALAAEMLLWLVNGPNMGDWSLQSQYLPPRYAAFDRWGDDPYIIFLRNELERSAMLPTTVSGAVSDALNQALTELFTSSTPDIPIIAATAVTAVK